MTTPDAEDASPSPEYSGDQDGSEMADQKDQRASSDAPSTNNSTTNTTTTTTKPNAKDPLRPRRKKARRACFACQRAHLTCGDERPCQRCIKRGLQDACHDGVRKKAKYLHDAPPEALMPGVGGHYPHLSNAGQQHGAASVPNNAQAMGQPNNFYPQQQQANYNVYPNSTQGQMPPPMQEASAINSYNNQQSPISPQYNQTANQQTSPVQSMAGMQQNQQSNPSAMQDFGGIPFDPSDPALFNFDLASLNFGNHYGALEFGMLGHMSSGAAETPPENNSVMNPLNQAANLYNGPMSTASGSSENLGISTGGFGFNDGIPTADWQPHSRQGSAAQIQTPNNTPATGNLDHQLRQQEGQNGMPLAYAVGAGPGSMASASPGSTMADGQNFEPTSFSSPAYMANQHSHQEEQRRQQIYNRQQQLHNQRTQQQQQHQQQQEANRKRRRDPSEIYDSVTGPYPYTDGFHGLIALLKQRFSIAKRSRIAQALASIRPSFIACTSTLNTDDLIFMEKSFQRTLYQYEDFINAHAVPTIICRRTGQIAAVSQEFSLLTGWKKDVLLGYEPNQNVNTGGSSGSAIQSGTATGTRGVNTPREQQPNIDSPRPVYLAEILDDNSVCQFYEDFAKLAFVAPRATATRSCKLIRYRTKDDLSNLENMNIKSEESGNKDQSKGTRYMNGNTVVKLEGGAGAGRPGDKDGLINCMFCWSVKRDVFEVPMLIVMNFLPIME
ncbi:Transcription activator of gluconeogenesis [Lasiodiplodia hormozganensis]|uniref:Transcription activator of gluconeogenesis n=1 Tax=Lasiodiplodia hormozganensis TaxID=869390 RepID=A0AA40CTB7_9PEZI|nr:Transcription activator of gluconeogenesis [Lasiodiplodia hormozganensis]